MPLHVINVKRKTPAAKLGIKNNATIYSINDKHLEDILDYYYMSAEEYQKIEFQNPDEERKIAIYENDFLHPFGIEFKQAECKQCINNCIFCFVDQMPDDMRKSLYIKDDDFYFSFEYGNFITLTNLTRHYLDKIIKQKISPLYISVHTTNPILHKKMMRYNREFNIIETLEELAKAGIDMHTQIVLVPEWNDGHELEYSLNDLCRDDYNIASIGLVPVGLTKYRQNLASIKSFDKKQCEEIIKTSQRFRNAGYDRLYCSDEIFITAEKEIPDSDYYNDYEQIENGIGMIRKTWDNYQNNKKDFLKLFKSIKKELHFVTGMLGQHALNPIIKDLEKKTDKYYQLNIIKNDFFGHSVTVVGLLTWQDVKKNIKPDANSLYAFSEDFFNYEGITLDNVSIKEIAAYLGGEILIIDPLFDGYRFFNS
ncbi:MAG: DUF512 domain-containing protein [Candidatus Cloacimonetes bacterium]|nr:DUF512 domain-containing protein [Candidatus Cloacimonadota bacterium]